MWAQLAGVSHEYSRDRFEGRGLVYCAGGERLFIHLWINLCILRRVLNCRLPVEVWHFGAEELTPSMAALLEPFAVNIVDGWSYARDLPEGEWRGFALKSIAVVHSRYREILYLDTDSYPVQDPSFLFDELPYRWTGSCFWPDVWRTVPESQMWDILDLPFVNEFEWDSGQVIIDKSRAWRALMLMSHLNRHHPYYYRHMHGDKMTFYAAWKKLDQPYAMAVTLAKFIASTDCRRLLNQYDFQGQLLFQHRVSADWSFPPADFSRWPESVHETACREFLEELRNKWPDSSRHCSPTQGGVPEKTPWRKLLRTIPGSGPSLPIRPPPSIQETGPWDAAAQRALISPCIVSTRMMETGIDALKCSPTQDMPGIFRFFAVMIFVDPRLATLLPEDLKNGGADFQKEREALLEFKQLASKQTGATNLLSVRGTPFNAGPRHPSLSPEEKKLAALLMDILAGSPSSAWKEWREFLAKIALQVEL